MFETLRAIISKADADYADIRYEILKETRVIFNGAELGEIGSNTTDGYVLRVLKNGGLSTIAFTKESDAEKAIESALENALLLSRNIKEPVVFATTNPIKGTFLPPLKEDPRRISIAEKLDLTRHYNNIPLKHEGISTTNLEYQEATREKYFASTEGSEIREDLVTTTINGLITSKDGNLIQNVRVGTGGSTGFAILRDREEEFERKTGIALDLLRAMPVKAGIYNVILDPDMAGVFTHEAFGHFSEADLVEDNPTMRERMRIGVKLGNKVLSIIDDPTIPGQLGFYKYDDEGVTARPVQLLKDGILVGRLHSRRTAASFGEPLSGHSIAEDYRFAPIIRMGNIFIQPGTSSLGELLEELADGLYILDAKGGQTSGENFTFGAQYAYRIKNGRLGEMIRDINISGNLYNTLQNITAVGNDLVLRETGGCGKGQTNIRSCMGGPHILVKSVVIGGA
ncbi:MAG: Metalloprotease TldD [Chloroflexi bacterium]|nr:Metalloprotease TldD [Chloroflexota bacterium]